MLAHKKKQERFHEELLNMNELKKELKTEMNVENKRVNVDSAKKLACLQHMDYDGFAQMVLGANLKPIKSGSAVNIYDPYQGANKMNPHANLQGIINQNYTGKDSNAEEIIRATLQIAQDESLHQPANQEEFEKFVTRKCSDSMQRYTYMRLIATDHYFQMFKREFSSELLLLLTRTFKEQVIDNQAFNNQAEQEFVVTVLQAVTKTPGFDFTLSFLEEAELNACKDLVFKGIDQIDEAKSKQLQEVRKVFNEE